MLTSHGRMAFYQGNSATNEIPLKKISKNLKTT